MTGTGWLLNLARKYSWPGEPAASIVPGSLFKCLDGTTGVGCGPFVRLGMGLADMLEKSLFLVRFVICFFIRDVVRSLLDIETLCTDTVC